MENLDLVESNMCKFYMCKFYDYYKDQCSRDCCIKIEK